MNENYLHFLWKNKRFPTHNLTTIEGRKIEILHVGIHNHDSGPDFFNGQIRIDEIHYSGNIEMHVKSSDWNLHGHQFDPAYSNVILHVVYEHDQLIFIEGIPIPTVELKRIIDWENFKWFNQYYKGNKTILCESFLSSLPPPIFWNQVERSLIQRVQRKTSELNLLLQTSEMSYKEVLFRIISKAFGMKVNQLPFQELANRIPFEKFIKASQKQKMAIAFGVSGFLENDEFKSSYQNELRAEWDFQRYKLKLHAANRHIWKFKGCRPGGFPTQRLAQFATFVHEMDWSSSLWFLSAKELVQQLQGKLMKPANEYWKTHFDFDKEKSAPSSMSIGTANTIIINSIVPFLCWLTEKLSDEVYRNRAFEILEQLPAENNEKVMAWKRIGFVAKNAFESQGLIELSNEFCTKKGCLKCVIGNTVLKV
ncbi:DUF2851 family protein [Fluviicola taffensis]|uniref:DUF2851 domain-containing protein n=1 Tax=Fluviicola taffensis (strain DSM 16823 / NCIMB 13979 / RW262) TaxID=755732 RepID=F2I9X2_FLUTR|nr:DUF2851 family protein [Fluviicola taffensis]AEA44130.1 hypothetical protein Fluta_2144 [Fluviicola taffensis DSM 16823]